MKLTQVLAVSLLGAMTASIAHAAPQNYWHDNGFTRFSAASQDGVAKYKHGDHKGKLKEGIIQEAHTNSPKNAPMKQIFDAEGLFYKRVGNTLYVGLQTGLNVKKGYSAWDPKNNKGEYLLQQAKNVYAGDIAISFKAKGKSFAKPLKDYMYGIDFGTKTKDWGVATANDKKFNHNVPTSENFVNAAGRSGVFAGNWVNKTSFSTAAFATAQNSEKLASLLSNESMTFKGIDGKSFARIVSFDLSKFGYTEQDKFSLHAYWTMSCGNDNVWGSTDVDATSEVPVPAAAWLFGSALLGLVSVKRKA